MKLPFATLGLICLTSFSCQKVKDLADKVRSKISGEIAKQAGQSAGSEVDPALQKLVDQTAEGVIFRKDLPFPTTVQVKTTTREEVSGRVSQKSELGKEAGIIKGTFSKVVLHERSGDRVTHTLIESVFAEPVIEGADPTKTPAPKVIELPSKPVVFVKSGSSWKPAVSTDFRAASLAQTLSPVFGQLLEEGALAPRSLWFGKKRFKPGDQLTVTGPTLPMLLAGEARGSLKLTFEKIDAVHGHPCGVFAVSGNFKRSQVPDFDGSLTDTEVSISSGKFWLSLLHPIVLKEETEIIQSVKSGGQGGLSSQAQSSAKTSLIREWKGG